MALSEVLAHAFQLPLYTGTDRRSLEGLYTKPYKSLSDINAIDLEIQIHGITDAKALQKRLIESNKLNLKIWLSKYQTHDGPTLSRLAMDRGINTAISLYNTPEWLMEIATETREACKTSYTTALGFNKDTAFQLRGKPTDEREGLLTQARQALPHFDEVTDFNGHLATLLELSITYNVLKNNDFTNRFQVREQAAMVCDQIIDVTSEEEDLKILEKCITVLPLLGEHKSLVGGLFGRVAGSYGRPETQKALLAKIEKKLNPPSPPSGPSETEMTEF